MLNSLNRRWLAVVFSGLLVVVVVVVGVPLLGSKTKKIVVAAKPLVVVPGPAGIVSGTTPNATGHTWVLVNLGKQANLQSINVDNGVVGGAVPLSNQSRVVAIASGGEVGVGLNGGTDGSVIFYSAQGFKLEGSVALSGPVLDLVAGSDGRSFYALVNVKGAESVSVIDGTTFKVTGSVPLPATSLSIAVSPDLTTIYSLLANGDIQIADVQTGKMIESLPSAAGGRQIALSIDGSTLYVLKGNIRDDNVSVIDVGTQSTVAVLPAPANCRWIAPSLNGSRLLDFVGTRNIGNLQTYATHR